MSNKKKLFRNKSTSYNRWYVRQNDVMVEIKIWNFAGAMSKYVADDHELAQQITRGLPGYGFLDMPSIVSEYNRFKSRPAAK